MIAVISIRRLELTQQPQCTTRLRAEISTALKGNVRLYEGYSRLSYLRVHMLESKPFIGADELAAAKKHRLSAVTVQEQLQRLRLDPKESTGEPTGIKHLMPSHRQSTRTSA